VKSFVVLEHFEAAVPVRNQLQGLNSLLSLIQDLLRQTDGAGLIVSRGAIFDSNFHRFLLCCYTFTRLLAMMLETRIHGWPGSSTAILPESLLSIIPFSDLIKSLLRLMTKSLGVRVSSLARL
jgi:hypothetical protein